MYPRALSITNCWNQLCFPVSDSTKQRPLPKAGRQHTYLGAGRNPGITPVLRHERSTAYGLALLFQGVSYICPTQDWGGVGWTHDLNNTSTSLMSLWKVVPPPPPSGSADLGAEAGEDNGWGGEPPGQPLAPAQPFPQLPLGLLGTN